MNNLKIYEYIKNGAVDDLTQLLEEGLNVNSFFDYDLTLLHGAVMFDRPRLVELLLSKGSNANVRSMYKGGYTPLHIAVEHRNIEIINLLLSYGAIIGIRDVNKITPFRLSLLHCNEDIVMKFIKTVDNISSIEKVGTIFHHAISKNWIHILSFLLKTNVWNGLCLPDDRPRVNFSPLHFAAFSGNIEIVKLLLAHNANVNAPEFTSGVSPLHSAIHSKSTGVEDMVLLLLNHGADFRLLEKNGKSILHYAAKNGWINVLKFVLNIGEDVNKCCSNSWPTDGYTPLHYGAEFNQDEVVELLLKHSADVNKTITAGFTPIILSIKDVSYSDSDRGKIINTFRLLLDGGADLNITDKKGKSVLHYAVELGIQEIIFLLLNKMNINFPTDDGVTPLHLAVSCNNRQLNIVRTLLEYGADIQYKDKNGRNVIDYAMLTPNSSDIFELIVNYLQNKNICYNIPSSLYDYFISMKPNEEDFSNLLLQAIEKGLLVLVKYFLDSGFCVNYKFSENNTPLHYAVINKHVDIISLLLDNGAQVNSENEKGETPLFLAIKSDHLSVIKCLLSFGAVIKMDFLFYAIGQCCPETVNILLWHDPNIANNINIYHQGKTLVHKATTNWDRQTIDSLIKLGADIELKNDKGLTALHLAVEQENIYLIVCLIKHGANVNSRDDQFFRTPLHLACKIQSLKYARALLRLGANINACDIQGQTPLHYAVHHSSAATIEFLLECGADINIIDSKKKSPLDLFRHPLRCIFPHNMMWLPFPIARILGFHICKLKAAEFKIYLKGPHFTRLVNEVPDLKVRMIQALNEIERLKKAKLSDKATVNLFDVLTKNVEKIEPLARNEEVFKIFNSADIRFQFPIYGQNLIYKFHNALERKNLLDHSLDIFLNLFSNLPLLPVDCVYLILNNLSNKELKIFCGNSLLDLTICEDILYEEESFNKYSDDESEDELSD